MKEQKDLVNTTHPDYDATAQFRTEYNDVIAGTAALRAKGKAYLPQFPAETDESWKHRVATATLQNIAAKTLETYCGLVFQKPTTLGENVPASFEDLAENIDNKGNHLNVFARDLFEDSFEGWSCILVDAPTQRANDLGQQKAMGLRPYWIEYCANDCINWDYQINPVSRRRELSLIVFRETITRKSGTFTRETVTQYRVYMLEKGRVIWQLWEEVKDARTNKIEHILVGDGTIDKQTSIPVAVVGELGNAPPMMDLVYKNIEHYQTYSDYKSIIHKTCSPLFYTVNLDGEPTALASDTWFKCNEGGSIGFAEVAGSSIDRVEASLDNIKKEMAQLGLSMLAGQNVQGDVTATETMLDSIQDTSALQVRAEQLKDAIEQAMMFTAQYNGESDGGSIELGANWTQIALTAQDMQTMNTLVSDGNLSLESFLYYMESAGKLPPDVDAEEELERIKGEEATLTPVLNARAMPNEQEQAKKPPYLSYLPNLKTPTEE